MWCAIRHRIAFLKVGCKLIRLAPTSANTGVMSRNLKFQPPTSRKVSGQSQGSKAKLSHRKFTPSSSPRRMTILLWSVLYIWMTLLQTILNPTNKAWHYCRQYLINQINQINQYEIKWPSHCQNDLWHKGEGYATQCLQYITGDFFAYPARSVCVFMKKALARIKPTTSRVSSSDVV